MGTPPPDRQTSARLSPSLRMRSEQERRTPRSAPPGSTLANTTRQAASTPDGGRASHFADLGRLPALETAAVNSQWETDETGNFGRTCCGDRMLEISCKTES